MRKYYAFYPVDAQMDLKYTLETKKKTKNLLEMTTESAIPLNELPPLYSQITGRK